ncbi:MAG: radical SAM family heme chaperone HemW [bacterium]|nr:radical SAM family heme chaperone HemW [bacterium]
MKPLYLYIHIPYCHHKCPYCDFNTFVENRIPQEEYALAIMAELDSYNLKPEWRDRELKTVYLGGGTPSLFESTIFRRIFYSIASKYKQAEDLEVTMESNPNDLSLEKLMELKELGVSRVSIGAQSFNAEILKQLGRKHDPENIIKSVENCRSVGFANISLDLIYGAPTQTRKDFSKDLEILALLKPEHASLYSLTIEKGTEFYTRHSKGQLKVPKNDVLADMMEEANEFLPKLGLQRYEVSNFAKEGFYSRHNAAYWDGSDYLGLGAGAHSMLTLKDGTRARWSNIANPKEFMQSVSEKGSAQAWGEKVEGAGLGFEYLMLGLRNVKGVSLHGFQVLTGKDIFSTYPGMVDALIGGKFLHLDGDNLRLTERGMAVADSVVENFIPEKGK